MATLPPAEVSYQESHLYQNETRQLSAFFGVCFVVSFICMTTRVAARVVTGISLKADDAVFLVGATLAEGSFIVLLIYAADAGLGEHWLGLTPAQMRLFPKLNYAYNILNVSCYPLIKISILLLYRRIFVTPRFRQIVWGCIALVAGIGISTTLVAIFSCTPVRAFYDSSVTGHCINDVHFYWASASLNVATDAIILTLPMPMVWRLQTDLRRKIGISLLFIIGGLTFIVSIIRIVYYLRFNAEDSSYSFIGDAYSTPGEVCLAIICACAPTWRPLSRLVLDKARSYLGGLLSEREYYDAERKEGVPTNQPISHNDNSKPTASSDIELADLSSSNRSNKLQDDDNPST
ncbi:hypothetical protein MMC20_005131 [Loxospora ochrophaea]|nr:hypothetical protein [Loxospora ochrophaea]